MERCVCSFFPLMIELRVGMMLLLSSHSFLNIGWLVTDLFVSSSSPLRHVLGQKNIHYRTAIRHAFVPLFCLSSAEHNMTDVASEDILLSQKYQNKKMFYSLYYSVPSMSHTQGFFCKIIRSVLHYFHLRPSLTTNSNRSYNKDLCGYLM